MSITHFESALRRDLNIGHLQGSWTMLGEAAGSIGIGLRRIQVAAGGWSTPAHEHGRQEEIFYVLAGRGLSWHAGKVSEVGPGDALVYHAGRGAHTMHATTDLDLLAFGPRGGDESPRFPRLGLSLLGSRAVESLDSVVDGIPIQFLRESKLGPPEIPATLDPRPSTIVNVAAVEPEKVERRRVSRTRRNLGRAAGSITTGLQHVVVAPGKNSSAQHCHSAEEELFVVLEGDGALRLGDAATKVLPGHVVSRPPGTGIAHTFRAGERGLTLLAYGTREPNDICYYPRSNKVWIRGVNLIARVERLDYWDGED